MGQHDMRLLESSNPMTTTFKKKKKENLFCFKLFGKFVLFADTVI